MDFAEGLQEREHSLFFGVLLEDHQAAFAGGLRGGGLHGGFEEVFREVVVEDHSTLLAEGQGTVELDLVVGADVQVLYLLQQFVRRVLECTSRIGLLTRENKSNLSKHPVKLFFER